MYYIPLNPAAPGVAKFVGGMMANQRAQKVTYDLKSQMAALLSGMTHSKQARLHSVRITTLPFSGSKTGVYASCSRGKGDRDLC